jgi:hypothetical protein
LICFDFCLVIDYYRRKLSEWENKEDLQLMVFFKKAKENKMLKGLLKSRLSTEVHLKDSLRGCLVKKD